MILSGTEGAVVVAAVAGTAAAPRLRTTAAARATRAPGRAPTRLGVSTPPTIGQIDIRRRKHRAKIPGKS